MAVESATYVNQLNADYPQDVDLKLEGAAHIRLEKSVLKASFPNVGGPVTATHAALSGIGVTLSQSDNSTNPASTAFVKTALLNASLSGQLPGLSGSAKKVLAVAADESGVEWTAVAQPIGTIASVAKTPPTDGTWLACDSSVYLQSSYAGLCAELGLIADLPGAIGALKASAYVATNPTAICFTGTEFIAAGGTVILRMGADGSGVTTATHGGTGLNAIVSDGAGLVLATPTSGTATVRSTDSGATWAAGGTIVTGTGFRGAYGNGTFVFVGNAKCATTPDGVVYTARTFAGNANGITHAGGTNWAASLANGSVMLSADSGATWGSDVATGLTSANGIAYQGGSLIALGQLNSKPAVALSRDGGATWRVVFNGALGGASYLQSAVFGAGIWMVLPNNASPILWSFDGGSSWQISSVTSLSTFMAYGNGRFSGVLGSATAVSYMPTQCLTYNTATQFAVPQPAGQFGAKQYIKAL